MKPMYAFLAPILSCLALGAAAPATAAPVLDFLPATQSFQTGDTVSVDVRVTGLAGGIVSAYDLDVTYDAVLLNAAGVLFGPNLGDATGDSISGFALLPGLVDLFEVSLLSDADLAALQAALGGTVPLATLSFTALADGDTSSLAFVLGFNQASGTFNDVKCAGNVQCIPQQIPEPGTLALLLTGLLSLASLVARRR
jgi:hypothetical protein